MALITCYECGKQISDLAPACPYCGAPAVVQQQTAQHFQQPMAQPFQQQAAQPFQPQINAAQRVGGKPPKARVFMPRSREALLSFALMCIGVILVCNVLVLVNVGKLDLLNYNTLGDKVQKTIEVSLWAGGIMIFILLLAMIFLLADRRAKQRIVGIGWLIYGGGTVGCNAGVLTFFYKINPSGWNRSEDIYNCKGCVWGSFGVSALLLFLIISVIVSTEKQIKEAQSAVQLS